MKVMWPIFVLGAVLCWGAYIPTLHHGQLGFGGRNSAFRSFLFVGIAYVIIAVIVPGALLAAKVEPASFPAAGMKLSTIAGILGAVGALCVIFAIKTGAKPIYMAPLIFGGAPIVNTFVSMVWDKPGRPPAIPFYLGIALVAVGAALVLLYKPVAAH